MIFRAGDPGDALYVLVEGAVRITVAEGRHSLQLSVVHPPAAVGVVGALDGLERTATAIAETDAALLRIGRDDLWAILAPDPVMMRGAVDAAAAVARKAAQAEAALLLSQPQRLAGLLLTLADQGGRVRLTQAELAGMLGTSRSHIVRMLGAFRAAGLIATSPGVILVLDRDGLARVDA
nr:Crp/Fnr family transcriptional regulator [Azospirillum doebereinerae]